jgi:hypothetical protein
MTRLEGKVTDGAASVCHACADLPPRLPEWCD